MRGVFRQTNAYLGRRADIDGPSIASSCSSSWLYSRRDKPDILASTAAHTDRLFEDRSYQFLSARTKVEASLGDRYRGLLVFTLFTAEHPLRWAEATANSPRIAQQGCLHFWPRIDIGIRAYPGIARQDCHDAFVSRLSMRRPAGQRETRELQARSWSWHGACRASSSPGGQSQS